MSDYQTARQTVRASLLAGGFSYTQADAVMTALDQLLEAFAAQKLAAVELALASQEAPSQ